MGILSVGRKVARYGGKQLRRGAGFVKKNWKKGVLLGLLARGRRGNDDLSEEELDEAAEALTEDGGGSEAMAQTIQDSQSDELAIKAAESAAEVEGLKSVKSKTKSITQEVNILSERTNKILRNYGLDAISTAPSPLESMEMTVEQSSGFKTPLTPQASKLDLSGLVLKYKQYNPDSKLDKIIELLGASNDILAVNAKLQQLDTRYDVTKADGQLIAAIKEDSEIRKLKRKEHNVNVLDARDEAKAGDTKIGSKVKTSLSKAGEGIVDMAKSNPIGTALGLGTLLSEIAGNRSTSDQGTYRDPNTYTDEEKEEFRKEGKTTYDSRYASGVTKTGAKMAEFNELPKGVKEPAGHRARTYYHGKNLKLPGATGTGFYEAHLGRKKYDREKMEKHNYTYSGYALNAGQFEELGNYTYLTSKVGWRKLGKGNNPWTWHSGIDLSTNGKASPVYSPVTGVVARSGDYVYANKSKRNLEGGNDEGGGRFISIVDFNGRHHLLMHLDKNGLPPVGKLVYRGDRVGTIANCWKRPGRMHLHYEIRVPTKSGDNVPRDTIIENPIDYLNYLTLKNAMRNDDQAANLDYSALTKKQIDELGDPIQANLPYAALNPHDSRLIKDVFLDDTYLKYGTINQSWQTKGLTEARNQIFNKSKGFGTGVSTASKNKGAKTTNVEVAQNTNNAKSTQATASPATNGPDVSSGAVSFTADNKFSGKIPKVIEPIENKESVAVATETSDVKSPDIFIKKGGNQVSNNIVVNSYYFKNSPIDNQYI